MERMTTLDAGFFFAEHANVPMHLGALGVFEGPAPSHQELAGLYAAKLPRVPRYRQVVRTAPLQLFRPAWIDDEHFDTGNHVLRGVVPGPGRTSELHRLAGQIYAQPLDRGRPLWEAWLLEGIETGRWAILSKVHHCMVDGTGGADLMAEVFDVHPDARPPVRPAAWRRQPGPSLAGSLASGLRDAVIRPLQAVFAVPGLVRERLPGWNDLAAFTCGLASGIQRLTVP
jgi:diacylglycerol O-acyltransferase / wax synthase